MLNNIKLKEAGFMSYEESKKVEYARKKLEYISSKLKNKKARPQIASILPEINDLSDEQLTKLVVTIVDTVHKYTKENEQQRKENICQNDGHIFTAWQEHKYTIYVSPAEAYGIEGLLNGGTNPTIPIKKIKWYRTCERCGFKEEFDKKN